MLRVLLILLIFTNVSFSQKTDTLGRYLQRLRATQNLPKIDSTKKIVVDSAKKVSFVQKLLFSDSTKKANIPRKALLRSLLLPGWGQATNKQYWLIPIVYAAAGGGIYAIKFNNDKYQFYKGYLANFVKDGAKEVTINGRGPFTQAQIEPAVKSYHRFRDLSYIGLALGWTLQAIQANVAAHLKGFDMSDDISLRFEPNIQPTSFGNAIGVKIALNFK